MGLSAPANAELSGRRRLYGACPFERRVRRGPHVLSHAHRHGRCESTLRARTLEKDTTIRQPRGRRTQPRCGLQREAANEEGQHGCRFRVTGDARHAATHVTRETPNAGRRCRCCRQTDTATCGRRTRRKHDRPGSQEAQKHGFEVRLTQSQAAGAAQPRCGLQETVNEEGEHGCRLGGTAHACCAPMQLTRRTLAGGAATVAEPTPQPAAATRTEGTRDRAATVGKKRRSMC